MDIQNLIFAISALTLILALISVIYTLGVVWRVEKKLDISYKFFLGAIVFFTLSEALNQAPQFFCLDTNDYKDLAVNSARLIFTAFFLVGILTMRSLIRKMDGEK